MKQMHDFKFKVPSFDYCNDYNSSLGDGDLVAAGFSWPPRSYICSFCKREFRSAQALGGHMNVHRRDRARLRQSPTRDGGSNGGAGGSAGGFPPFNLNLEPNPSFHSNPSSSPNLFRSSPPRVSSLSTRFPQFTSKFAPPTSEIRRHGAPVESCKPITADFMRVKAAKGVVLGVDRLASSGRKKGCEGFKKPGIVRLDLEIGLIRPSKEELDLELRLGYT